ncbi:MAG: HdeD family acid-resistance protein [Lamprobacter sp.]|uniref:HdeD family acid-resistance protein n=1 Tax=Lamprobacter sp. TaxID=3100796 RepID=UPI002B259586|nr:HdeD family acid-resistance protein [Lamprobacter sp.]MEA3642204.1 HdeD family acid-resistance protein [Lamprobacter sp.]
MTDIKTNPAVAPIAPFGDLEKNWGWLLAFGLLSIVLGTIGLGMTFMLTELAMVFFAALLIVGGVFQLLDALKCNGWKSTAWHVLIALLYVAAGVYMTLHPTLAAVSLTLLLGAMFITVGLLRSIMAFQLKPAKGWWWPLVSGVISLILGGLILAEWPQSGLFIIGLFIAIELIFNGWSYLFIALAARAAGKQRQAGESVSF